MIRWYIPNTMDSLDSLRVAVFELYQCWLELIRLRLMMRAAKRPADVKFYSRTQPKLLRWHLLPVNPFLNIWLHHVVSSDEANEGHGHRQAYLTVILHGGYIEHIEGRPATRLSKGQIAFRSRRIRHRVELPTKTGHGLAPHSWSLVITGPTLGFSGSRVD